MQGAVADVKIPATLAPGNYLIRHEIIALHLAQEQGGAEFYPGCAQLKIGGNQNGRPNDNELVSFPGGYSDNDAGIKVNVSACFHYSVYYRWLINLRIPGL